MTNRVGMHYEDDTMFCSFILNEVFSFLCAALFESIPVLYVYAASVVLFRCRGATFNYLK